MTAVVVVPFDLAFIDLATAHMYHPIQILINLIDVIFLVDIVLKRVSAGSEDALPRELEGGGGAKDRRTGVESVRTRPSGTGRFNTAIRESSRSERDRPVLVGSTRRSSTRSGTSGASTGARLRGGTCEAP